LPSSFTAQGYTALVKLGKSPTFDPASEVDSMPRLAVLIVIILLLLGALVFLGTSVREVPTTTIETDVEGAPGAR
jgi:hypothetical protein